MDKCGIPAIANINIFGVRKNRIKELKELDNWVKLEEKLKIETAKITDEHIAALVVAELLDLYNNRVYTNAKVAELVGPDSDYAKYVSLYGNVKRSDGNVAQLSDLCAKYGKAVQVEKIKKSIEKIKTALHAKYPLLKFMDSRVSNDDLVHYIKLVDNTGETK
jgi:phosphoribulokinase